MNLIKLYDNYIKDINQVKASIKSVEAMCNAKTAKAIENFLIAKVNRKYIKGIQNNYRQNLHLVHK